MSKRYILSLVILLLALSPVFVIAQTFPGSLYYRTLVNEPVYIGGGYWANGGPAGGGTGNIVTNPVHGTVAFDSLYYYGWVYTPDVNFAGTDSLRATFCYDPAYCNDTVTIYIEVVHYYPAEAFDDYWDVETGNTASVNVLSNDYGPQISVTSISQPANGSAVNSGGGVIDYTPAAGYLGLDGFTYTITDSAGNTATANVQINVVEVGSLTYTQHLSTEENTPVYLYSNVYGGGGTLLAGPYNGTLVFDSLNYSYVYTPNNGFLGQDSMDFSQQWGGYIERYVIDVVPVGSLVYAIQDEVFMSLNDVSVTIDPLQNDGGTGLTLGTVGAPQYGSISVSGGTVTYTAGPDFLAYGYDYFEYQACNAYTCATSYIMVQYNYTPGQLNVFVGTPENTPVDIAFNTGTPVSASLNYAPLNGTVSFSSTSTTVPVNGTTCSVFDLITYTPNAGFTGLDPFLIDAYTYSGLTIGRYLITVDVGGSGSQRMYVVEYGSGNAVDVTNATGISTLGAISLNVSPIPVISNMKITAGRQLMQSIEIYSLVGERIYNDENIGAAETIVSFPDVANGLYLVKVKTADGTYTRKVFKGQ